MTFVILSSIVPTPVFQVGAPAAVAVGGSRARALLGGGSDLGAHLGLHHSSSETTPTPRSRSRSTSSSSLPTDDVISILGLDRSLSEGLQRTIDWACDAWRV